MESAPHYLRPLIRREFLLLAISYISIFLSEAACKEIPHFKKLNGYNNTLQGMGILIANG